MFFYSEGLNMTQNLSHDFSKVTEVELIYRNPTKPSERPGIRNSKDAYDLFMKSWDEGKIEIQEQFRVMLLDKKNSCLGISTSATGGISTCIADLKIIFATALKAGASSIILAHNHPSGNLSPSEADKSLTARFVYAGNILEIPVLDHIIVTSEGYTSLADDGCLIHQPPESKSCAHLFSSKSSF